MVVVACRKENHSLFCKQSVCGKVEIERLKEAAMSTKILIGILLAAVIITAGCSKKLTYHAPDGSVTVETSGDREQKVEIKTEEGKATVVTEKRAITEKELGVPVYPGAVSEMSGQYEGAQGDEIHQMQQHMLTTPDDFDEVVDFYKSKLKDVQGSFTQTIGDDRMSMFTAKSTRGGDVSVQIMTDSEEKVTRILVIDVGQSGR